MKTQKILISLFAPLVFSCLPCVDAAAPSGLMVDLLEQADRVWLDGYPSTVPLSELGQTIERFQTATVYCRKPAFSWIVEDERKDVLQTAYRLLAGTDRAALEKEQADLWDSGKVESDASVAVSYDGKPLPGGSVVYWRVKTWNNGGEQPFSAVKAFYAAQEPVEYRTARYPLQKTDQAPTLVEQRDDHTWIDFGKAAFGRLRLSVTSDRERTVTLHFGEAAKNGRIDRKPGGTIRYAAYSLNLMKGTHTYTVKFRPDKRNTGATAIKMPGEIGEVYPFRYVELEPAVPASPVVREMVHYPFDDTASRWDSSDEILDRVWDLCKYSIQATSFAGVYVDGDRERIPYEADALINQLCHYGVDREFSLARHSHEYLIRHATWPTEWILQSVLMAHYDYLYTGDIRSAQSFYEDLRAKLLLPLADPDSGLISTRLKSGPRRQTPELLKSIHFGGKELRDIVDWPHKGILGLGKAEGGEADGYVFKDYNAVVNAYHFQALVGMSLLAEALDRKEDAKRYAERAARVKTSFNRLFFDGKNGRYIDGFDADGAGTDHAALHANMFPMAFGLVPGDRRTSVTEHVKSRGMACSVYGSQFLMEAIYDAGDARYGLELLSSESERSWYNMIRVGSTISLEAWDNKYKPNQDWNHAWGAAPANIIPRKLVGVEPLEPGFKTARIKPQPGSLDRFESKVPTIRGPVTVRMERKAGGAAFELVVPANMRVRFMFPLPEGRDRASIRLDGEPVEAVVEGGLITTKNPIGSGARSVVVE